ncbi:MAG: alpha/beta hydrolase [Rikenellaceae bacterium]
MFRLIIISLLLFFQAATASLYAQFRPDILGEGFEQLTIEQPDDYDGQVVTTVVRHTPIEGVTRAVLYVHGYNDYFFQREMAEQFIDQGWQFYAVDLRRYGRSIRSWQTPYKVYEIEEYFADIDAAIDVMQAQGVEQIVLMAHSTGGLTTPLYCHANRENLRVDALILNSPFFDMNLGAGLFENLGVPIVSTFGALFRDCVVQGGTDSPGGYGRSLHVDYDGEWSFDTSIKRLESLPITTGWIRAIHLAQKELQRGLEIPCPTLVLYSDKSVSGEYSGEYMHGDSVLDVADIAKYAAGLGPNVTQIEVAGGMHDLVLSAPEVRHPLYLTLFEWLADRPGSDSVGRR